MQTAVVRENADFIGIHAREYIAVLIMYRLLISFICRHINGLCIAEAVHNKHHFLLLHLFLL